MQDVESDSAGRERSPPGNVTVDTGREPLISAGGESAERLDLRACRVLEDLVDDGQALRDSFVQVRQPELVLEVLRVGESAFEEFEIPHATVAGRLDWTRRIVQRSSRACLAQSAPDPLPEHASSSSTDRNPSTERRHVGSRAAAQSRPQTRRGSREYRCPPARSEPTLWRLQHPLISELSSRRGDSS